MYYILAYEYIISLIYKHKNAEIRSTSMLLAYLLLSLNIYSFLIWIELKFDLINVSSIWRPTSFAKAPLGFIVGALLFCLVYFIRKTSLKKHQNIEKKELFRRVIMGFKNFRLIAIVYLIFSLLFFIWSFITLVQLTSK